MARIVRYLLTIAQLASTSLPANHEVLSLHIFLHRIVQCLLNFCPRVQLIQSGIISGRINPIRQEDVQKARLGIHPRERSSETRVTKA